MDVSNRLFIEMAYALGIGLLIGLERSMPSLAGTPNKKPDEPDELDADEAPAPGPDPANDDWEALGIRTFTVLSLLGFGAAVASDRFPLIAPVALGGVCVLVIALYIRAKELGFGITTELAAITTCGLGVLCHHHPHAAGALALVLTVVLSSKRLAHSTVRKMRRVELTDTLKFLIAIFIVLPLLPNKALDPYGALNPFKVGLLVVLISGISFVGYFLTRLLGAQKGLGLTGIVGGLTSSTAVTAAMAQEAKEQPHLNAICVFSTVGANATMFVRVLVVVALLDPALALKLAWAIGAMGVVAVVLSAVLWFRAGKSKESGEGHHQVQLKNPFSIGPALKFAAFFVAILFAAKLAKIYFGNQGLYLAALMSGLADVDAITLTIAEQSKAGTLAQNIGALAITIAVVSNSVVKTGIAIYVGGWKFGRLVGLCLGLATGAGLAVAFFV
jgi:uncharacterized membrane protein (DUF4010 family)